MQQQQQQPSSNAGIFVVGIVVGFFAGGTVLSLVALLVGVGIAQALSRVTSNDNLVAFATCYAIAAAAGVLAFVLVRKSVNFLSGLVVGVTAGLLGGITLCNGIIGAFNNPH